MTKHTPNFYLLAFASFSHLTHIPSPSSFYVLSPSRKMADSDLFDGAIGIDLGTTYSYVSALASTLLLSLLIQLRGCMAK
jgi:hypothetical protein